MAWLHDAAHDGLIKSIHEPVARRRRTNLIVQYKNDLNETNWNFATQINTRTTSVIEIVPADAQVFSPSDGIDNFDPGPDRTINFQFQ